MTAHAYTEDLLVEQPAIRLFLQPLPLCKGRLHHAPICPTAGWSFGAAAPIPRLGRHLNNELPEEKGFSERTIKRMLACYRARPHVVPQPVAQRDSDAEGPQTAAPVPPDLLLPRLLSGQIDVGALPS